MNEAELADVVGQAVKERKGLLKTMLGDFRNERGAKRLKRELLGYFGQEVDMGFERLGELLSDLGIASSSSEGESMVPHLIAAYNQDNCDWGLRYSTSNFLQFTATPEGQCRVRTQSTVGPPF